MADSSYTFITGASSGIGAAIARQLAGSRRLILCGRDGDRLEAVRAACANAPDHLIWMQDLARPTAAGEALAALLAERGIAVAHFIHSASLFDARPIHTVDLDEAGRLFNVNLFSAIELVRQLSRKRVNRGMLRSVTFISSIAGRTGIGGYHVYAASKGALNALARSLAVELAPEVRVNCILPGGVETEGTRALFANPHGAASLPLGLGSAADIADAVEFIVSDKARWITGQEIVVDGGRSII